MEETKRRRFIIRAMIEGEVDVQEEPSEPKSDMNGWADGIAYTDLEIVSNEYVRSNNGQFAAYNGWSRTGFVYCEGASTITFPPCASDSGGSTIINENGWYTTNDVSGYISKMGISKTTTKTVTVPENAKYFVISATDQGLADCIAAGIVPHA